MPDMPTFQVNDEQVARIIAAFGGETQVAIEEVLKLYKTTLIEEVLRRESAARVQTFRSAERDRINAARAEFGLPPM